MKGLKEYSRRKLRLKQLHCVRELRLAHRCTFKCYIYPMSKLPNSVLCAIGSELCRNVLVSLTCSLKSSGAEETGYIQLHLETGGPDGKLVVARVCREILWSPY